MSLNYKFCYSPVYRTSFRAIFPTVLWSILFATEIFTLISETSNRMPGAALSAVSQVVLMGGMVSFAMFQLKLVKA